MSLRYKVGGMLGSEGFFRIWGFRGLQGGCEQGFARRIGRKYTHEAFESIYIYVHISIYRESIPKTGETNKMPSCRGKSLVFRRGHDKFHQFINMVGHHLAMSCLPHPQPFGVPAAHELDAHHAEIHSR